jgi:hypothetical protein
MSGVSLWLGCAPPSDPDEACGPGASGDEASGRCFCDPGFFGDPDTECAPHPDLCEEANARLSHRVCAHTVDDEVQWTQLSIGGGAAIAGIRRVGKYMVPIGPQARLPTVFADANSYRLHYCLMSSGFAPLFPGLTTADHAELILTRAGREYYAGSVYEFQASPGSESPHFGFSIETAIRPEEMLDADTIYGVYRQLSDRFAPGDLGYLPRGTLQEATAAAWVDPPMPVLTVSDGGVAFEAYTPGIAYGRVRTHRVGEPSDYGWQDIVVFDEVPVDFEGVLAGAVTGQRQDILSHLNVLSAQRGTPNFFVDDAVAVFTQFEGQLVRIEAESYNYKLTAASEAEAAEYWEEHRPRASVANPAEYDFEALEAFAAIETATADDRARARARFGAKTVGLATLSKVLDPRYQTPGLGVPFHYYGEFMDTNVWTVDLGDGAQPHTYAETIAAWLSDDDFRTNTALRKERLASLREEMRTRGVVSEELVTALRERIVTEFGADSVMVRVRSSSNAEDSPSFNGAGLYDSTSACAADADDAVAPAVSACDPSKDPRSLERALAKVWASLWNFGAFEERDYYQLDHADVAMGATVSLRYEAERANGVAFTGDPVDPKHVRYTVNVQSGEVDVVSATPGVTAELSLLTIVDGAVSEIERAVESSIVTPGEQVLTDAQLTELGGVMAQLARDYPVDVTVADGPAPILDLEFKITAPGALVIKQIRTFLPVPYASDPTCRD